MRTFCIVSLGCKVNRYEADQIAAFLRSRGLSETADPRDADLRVVHTCAVTSQAASQSRQAIRRLVRTPRRPCAAADNPAAPPPILVSGCGAAAHAAEARGLPHVAAIGHDEDVGASIDRLLSLWRPGNPQSPRHPVVSRPLEPPGHDGWMMRAGAPAWRPPYCTNALPPAVNQQVAERPAARPPPPAESCTGTTSLPPPDIRRPDRQRALLKIQDGCDRRCTYCIVPAIRRRLWSKPPDQVVREAAELISRGYAEIVLTGVCLGLYGRDSRHDICDGARAPGTGSAHLAGLIAAMARNTPALQRLRLSSIDPADLTPELVSALRACCAVVPHFHLPVQSGSDRILRRMNRRYDRSACLAAKAMLCEAFDRPALTTDVIVGFPGEMDEDFAQTLDLVGEMEFVQVHAFRFSPREGTPAARWTGDYVAPAVAAERLRRLRQHARAASMRYRRRFLGEIVSVVVERRPDDFRRDGTLIGRSDRYFSVRFPSVDDLAGHIALVRVERITADETHGTLVAVADAAATPRVPAGHVGDPGTACPPPSREVR